MTKLQEVLLITFLSLTLYVLWVQKGEIELLNDDVQTLRAQIGELMKRPTVTARTRPKPKPRPPGTATA